METYVVLNTDTTQLSRQVWLVLRRQGIGSSDAAACVGLSPWQSRYSLFCDKRGLTPLDGKQSPKFEWAIQMEEPIYWQYLLDHGPEVIGTSDILRHHMLRSTQYPWMTANPDALVPGREVVEIKTAHGMDEKRWEEGIPTHYTIQAIHLMIVTGERHCIMPVSFGGQPPRYFHLDYDEDTAASLIAGELKFWQDVLDNVEPDPDGSQASMEAIRARFLDPIQGYSVEATSDILVDVEQYRVAANYAKEATADMNAAKARIMAYLGEAERLEHDGATLCTWRATKAGTRVLRFAEEKP